MVTVAPLAPELQTQQWFNAREPVALGALRGKIVVIEAFQMLCPGCVSHGLPQATRIHDTFDAADVVVLGLHTVFEHHAAMTPVSLASRSIASIFPSALTRPAATTADCRRPWRPTGCRARRH